MLQGVRLEIVDDYSYLGICFKYNGTFAKVNQHIVDQAQKALFFHIPKHTQQEHTCLIHWSNQFYYTAQKCGVMKTYK